VAFLLLIVGYAFGGAVLFGGQIEEFGNFGKSIVTVVNMIFLGDHQWAQMKRIDYWAALFFFWSYVVILFLVMLNILLAIVIDTYEKTKETIVDCTPAVSFPTIYCARHVRILPHHIFTKLYNLYYVPHTIVEAPLPFLSQSLSVRAAKERDRLFVRGAYEHVVYQLNQHFIHKDLSKAEISEGTLKEWGVGPYVTREMLRNARALGELKKQIRRQNAEQQQDLFGLDRLGNLDSGSDDRSLPSPKGNVHGFLRAWSAFNDGDFQLNGQNDGDGGVFTTVRSNALGWHRRSRGQALWSPPVVFKGGDRVEIKKGRMQKGTATGTVKSIDQNGLVKVVVRGTVKSYKTSELRRVVDEEGREGIETHSESGAGARHAGPQEGECAGSEGHQGGVPWDIHIDLTDV
jgi:hypothetical protein